MDEIDVEYKGYVIRTKKAWDEYSYRIFNTNINGKGKWKCIRRMIGYFSHANAYKKAAGHIDNYLINGGENGKRRMVEAL